MKGTIKLFSEELANKIAAGEVVESAFSVVKELVENSLDAKSSEIKISLEEAGLKSITVKDNGIGMSKEDALMSLKRHASSKIYDFSDLLKISSLGFRGEAIPSIASVSNFTLKTSDGKEGTKIIVKGGKEESISSMSLIKGTSICVKDLFYNTPARLKYIKNKYAELYNITTYLNKISLAYPSVKIILENNNKTIINTSGNGNIKDVISTIYSINLAKEIIYTEGDNNDYEVKIYLSPPSFTRRTSDSITVIVNGRSIKNYRLNKVITDIYSKYIPPKKYPYVILYIEADPQLLDVNIHPNKKDIKFSKMATLEMLIEDLIGKALKQEDLIPFIDSNKFSPIIETGINDFNYEDLSFDLEESYLDLKSFENIKIEFRDLRLIGVYQKTYLILEGPKALYLIDQHAAAERINYEKVLASFKNKKIKKIDLLIPYEMELEKKDLITFNKHKKLLEETGFKIDLFGDKSIIIRSVPDILNEKLYNYNLKDIILELLHEGDLDKDSYYHERAATIACKMSLKAKDNISENLINDLLTRLFKCDNPYNCPHGRPVIIKFSNYELEKMFKRIMN